MGWPHPSLNYPASDIETAFSVWFVLACSVRDLGICAFY
jgi:hypothetical protein